MEYPVKIGATEITGLQMRRPRVKDQMIADKQNKHDSDKEIHLFALLCEVDPSVIQELDMDDYEAVKQVFLGFRKKNPPKNSESETSSAA
ncbi:phage tail assembly protein [Photobacterium galatheae]|uniref:phage tail assembly protein n=1 Tax=Photobacterium galatheae TaxID=1654360 RepID=UPI001F2C9506|nr:phage tail assembly protein [Photobacterium galatheae]